MKQLLKSFHLNAWLSVAASEGQDLVIANTSGKSVLIKWNAPLSENSRKRTPKLRLSFSSKIYSLQCTVKRLDRLRSPVLIKKESVS